MLSKKKLLYSNITRGRTNTCGKMSLEKNLSIHIKSLNHLWGFILRRKKTMVLNTEFFISATEKPIINIPNSGKA